VLLAGLSSLAAAGVAILVRPDRAKREQAAEPADARQPVPAAASAAAAGSDEAA
jgi:hypothetical protein